MDQPNSHSSTSDAARVSVVARSLIETAKSLISDGGVDSVTVDDIVRMAGVSKRSFHNHFIDVHDLVMQAFRQVREELDARIEKVVQPSDNPALQLACGVFTAFRYGIENRLDGAALSQISRGVTDPTDPSARLLVNFLSSGINQGEFAVSGIDSAVVWVIGVTDIAMSQLRHNKLSAKQKKQLMLDLCVVLLRGLTVRGDRATTVAKAAWIRVFGGDVQI